MDTLHFFGKDRLVNLWSTLHTSAHGHVATTAYTPLADYFEVERESPKLFCGQAVQLTQLWMVATGRELKLPRVAFIYR